MVAIARCESNLEHYDDKGNVLRGVLTPSDVGLFQISEKYWLKESKKVGIDFYTVIGNIKMAEYIREKQGLDAWKASKHCWGETNQH